MLAHDEILTGIRIPRLRSGASWGFHKICRKVGAFAEAIGVVVDHGGRRLNCVAGATGGAPVAVDLRQGTANVDACRSALAEAGYKGDDYDMQVHAVALAQAFAGAGAK